MVENKSLRWLGTLLHRDYLWKWSRHGVALGVAIGVYWGVQIPMLQILLAAVCALAFRANLPVAAFATFISNPVTYAPIYYAGYRLGKFLLGLEHGDHASLEAVTGGTIWDSTFWQKLSDIALPFLTGSFVLATITAILAYAIVNAVWLLSIRRKYHRIQASRLRRQKKEEQDRLASQVSDK